MTPFFDQPLDQPILAFVHIQSWETTIDTRRYRFSTSFQTAPITGIDIHRASVGMVLVEFFAGVREAELESRILRLLRSLRLKNQEINDLRNEIVYKDLRRNEIKMINREVYRSMLEERDELRDRVQRLERALAYGPGL